ncbi:MAG TPA: DUF3857 domain-containing transglutaminase family protein [Mesorhizobium sp.]|uniref:DUF3857 domain-containing transglutaminase family protein n=1 Tax=Mesorhizobium sp. TaxID=1871066 RepID=UPI002DDD6DA1|nr:DUF3857 domain-containing transglutaminase family protein [Mesorhizobium sp.]HEV2506366.1 DUF3857 domain-containing transglutaminase family protein [Mesorhizobium sp.]
MALAIQLSIFIYFFGFCQSALAKAEISKTPAGEWVDWLDLPAANSRFGDQARDGTLNILSDYQFKHRADGYEIFDRFAYKILDRVGLENGATITVEFDPATMDVAINRLSIVRDGVVIDRLPQISFDIVRREKDAEKGIFDGWLTAYVNIPDVRVGDVIDYAKTIVRKPILGANLFFDTIPTAWRDPVLLINERIIWPSSQPLHIRQIQTEVQPQTSPDGTDTVYRWQVRDPEPVKSEASLPADAPSFPMVQVSSTNDWQDIVNVVLPFYQLDQELPADFAAKLDAIATIHAAPEDRLIEAARLVQDTIRYVSLSMGRGSYVPRIPSAVIASGFGDCKDKALLLAVSLHRLGIAAVPALTDIDEGQGLQNILPTLRAFDHVIVKATLHDQIYWIDATNYLQGGRAGNLVFPDYGYALPIVAGRAAIEQIERRELIQPTSFVEEQFDFPRRTGEGLKLTVKTTYLDDQADTMRYKIASQSLPKISDDYINYYNGMYPGITRLKPLSTTDDRDKNEVTVSEAYELSDDALYADDLIKQFPLKADIGTSNLPEPSSVKRRGPIAIGAPMFRRHKILVKNLKARFVLPEHQDVLTPFVAFKTDWSNTPTEFELEWLFKTLDSRVPARGIRSYLKSVKQISDKTYWTYDFSYSDAEAKAN